jgi:hypothetical protein
MAEDNIFEKIGTGIETAAVDTVKGIEEAFTIAGKTKKVLDVVVADETTFKPALEAVVTGAVTIGGDLAQVIAAKGTNWVQDEKTVSDIEAYFKTTVLANFVPEVEKLDADIKTAVA